MIKFNCYDNENKEWLQLLRSDSAKAMLRLCENMLEFCLGFLALIQQQVKRDKHQFTHLFRLVNWCLSLTYSGSEKNQAS